MTNSQLHQNQAKPLKSKTHKITVTSFNLPTIFFIIQKSTNTKISTESNWQASGMRNLEPLIEVGSPKMDLKKKKSQIEKGKTKST